MRAKALVAFPGGFGTLDELFEVITLVQTRKAKPVPIVLFGTDYWKRLINIDVMIEEGVISAEDLKLFQYVDEPEAAWDVIQELLRFVSRWAQAARPSARPPPRRHPPSRTPATRPSPLRPCQTAWASARWTH